MAATQRPATQEALVEASGESSLWKRSAVVVPDRRGGPHHPAKLQHYMAERARAHRVIEVPGASHAITVSHPDATAHLILEAAALRVAA